MLHYDVIGFQSVEWLESFLHYCRKELNAEVDEDSGTVRIGGRTAVARDFTIGIDYREIMALGETGMARRAQDRLAGTARHRPVVIVSHRAAHSKGKPERHDSMDRLILAQDDMDTRQN